MWCSPSGVRSGHEPHVRGSAEGEGGARQAAGGGGARQPEGGTGARARGACSSPQAPARPRVPGGDGAPPTHTGIVNTGPAPSWIHDMRVCSPQRRGSSRGPSGGELREGAVSRLPGAGCRLAHGSLTVRLCECAAGGAAGGDAVGRECARRGPSAAHPRRECGAAPSEIN
eukprot:280475-Prorocentrum_minimum.AAC.6